MNDKYKPRFHVLLETRNPDNKPLPASLKKLIEQFEIAHAALGRLKSELWKIKCLDMLVQTDAIICTSIEKLFKTPVDKTKKMKLMAMKARALKLKLKLMKGED